ncbi:hypothetical protein GGR54DRAFT_619157 [Hypoxylon sp. NC1633]|nr:hypothetical protein GGR54DRAFT_619157 [Hypoxylon sp. NC1633]
MRALEDAATRTTEPDFARDLQRRLYEDAPKRTSDPSDHEWAVIRNYKTHSTSYLIRGEVALAYQRFKSQPRSWGIVQPAPDDSQMASYTRTWGPDVFSLGLTGINGCTVIAVLSERGVWVGYIWEMPNFTRDVLIPSGFTTYNAN